MIYGVIVKKLKVIADERGRLMEILRSDDNFFEKFGQVYMTTAYPGVVKGWHYHKKQYDNMAVVKGMMKIVLYDSRKESVSFGEINEIIAGIRPPTIEHILLHHFFSFLIISLNISTIIFFTSQQIIEYL